MKTEMRAEARSWVSDLEEWVWKNGNPNNEDTEHFMGNIVETLGLTEPGYEHLATYASWEFEFTANWAPECLNPRCQECPIGLTGKVIIKTHHGERYTYYITTCGLEP